MLARAALPRTMQQSATRSRVTTWSRLLPCHKRHMNFANTSPLCDCARSHLVSAAICVRSVSNSPSVSPRSRPESDPRREHKVPAVAGLTRMRRLRLAGRLPAHSRRPRGSRWGFCRAGARTWRCVHNRTPFVGKSQETQISSLDQNASELWNSGFYWSHSSHLLRSSC